MPKITRVVSLPDGTLWVEGVIRGIETGAYLEPISGRILLNDHQEWCWEDDMERAGVPERDWSALKREWIAYLRSRNWARLAAQAEPVVD